jgi:O-antigen ligase
VDLVQGVGAQDPKRSALSSVAVLAALAWVGYFILIGGSEAGLLTPIAIANAMIGSVASALWIRQMLRGSDLADRLLLGSLLLALAACVLSTMPRSSLAAAMSYMAFASLLGLARRQLANEGARRLLLVLLAAIGSVLVVVTLAVWGTQWWQWVTAHGGVPPLDLVLSDLRIYSFKYQLAILIGMLIPALIGARKAGLPGWLVWPPVMLCGFAVIAGGSRSAWLGGLAMFLVLATPRIRLPSPVRSRVLLGISIVLLAALFWQTGLLAAFFDRALAASTVSLRGAIWTDALGQFVRNPLAGSGPGTFATTITTSGYFKDFARVGMGPDSSPVELISESGLLGVCAVLLMAASVGVGLRSSPSPYGRLGLAALAMFAVSSLTNDTVHSAQHVALAGLFMALAAPSSGRRVVVPPRRRSEITIAMGVAGGIVVAYVIALQVAAVMHLAAVANAQSGDPGATVSELQAAVALDPGNGLYWRELALGRLMQSDLPGSVEAFQFAVELSPGDMAARRGLAITRAELHLGPRALAASKGASDLRPTDPMNLVTDGYVAHLVGDSRRADVALREAIEAAPWLPAAPTWDSVFASGSVRLGALYKEAAAEIGPPGGGDDRKLPQRVWLLTLAKLPVYPAPQGLAATKSILQCDEYEATLQINSLFRTADVTQWDIIAEAMVLRLTGRSAELHAALNAGMLRDPATAVLGIEPYPAESPYVDRIEDWRIYRNIEPTIPAPALRLPSSQEALSRWMIDPVAAVRSAAPDLPLATCGIGP